MKTSLRDCAMFIDKWLWCSIQYSLSMCMYQGIYLVTSPFAIWRTLMRRLSNTNFYAFCYAYYVAWKLSTINSLCWIVWSQSVLIISLHFVVSKLSTLTHPWCIERKLEPCKLKEINMQLKLVMITTTIRSWTFERLRIIDLKSQILWTLFLISVA